jgi:hypothetical protein
MAMVCGFAQPWRFLLRKNSAIWNAVENEYKVFNLQGKRPKPFSSKLLDM